MNNVNSFAKWQKINVWLKFSTADIHATATKIANDFCAQLYPQHMYFATYATTAFIRVEISALFFSRRNDLTKFFKKFSEVKNFNVQPRGTGSLAHARAYQMVRALEPVDGDWDKQLADVIHWIFNMRGYNYMRELLFYNQAGVALAHHLATEGDEYMKKHYAIKVEEEKVPAAALESLGRSPRCKPAKSSRAQRGKVGGSTRKLSAGLDRL
jgi:hypothetical protein